MVSDADSILDGRPVRCVVTEKSVTVRILSVYGATLTVTINDVAYDYYDVSPAVLRKISSMIKKIPEGKHGRVVTYMQKFLGKGVRARDSI